MSKITEKRATGNLGEDLACRFLIKKGHDIIERNYLKKCGEIDIISKQNNILHFIEVKSVSCETTLPTSHETESKSFRPEDNVHTWKIQRLAKTIQMYLLEKDVSPETNWQFDIITVNIDKKNRTSRVKMLENLII